MVTLAFSGGAGAPHGFICRDPSGELIASRVVPVGRVALVVDFFVLAGTPSCRGAEIVQFCRDASDNCSLDLAFRDHVVVDLRSPGAGSLGEAVREGFASIAGHVITDEAPDATVVIRVVGTVEPCFLGADIASCPRSFDPDDLVGCVNTCPVYLPKAGSEVGLDLDVFPPESCTLGQVEVCATADLTAE